MSVLRPKPPTDPIEHHPPSGVRSADGRTDPRWQAWLDRAEAVRGRTAPSSGTATEAMLRAYGTTGSRARRRDSVLFRILEDARRVRESVDRVVVIGDRADRALVDLLLSTCCHPRHDALPRHERGGRPRIWTLGPDDDDDTVQGILDALGPQSGDRLLDAWGVVVVGPCREAFTQDCVRLFAPPSDVPGQIALSVPGASGDAGLDLTAPRDDDGGVFTAAALLPAAIAGIDVVRLLEGAITMARRFREAPAEANPVVSLALVGRWLAPASEKGERRPRRRLVPPARWQGLVAWHEATEEPSAPAPATEPAEARFDTAITVAEHRRAPFASIPRAAPAQSRRRAASNAADRLVLPRCDEHTIGQLLEGLRLAAAIDSALD